MGKLPGRACIVFFVLSETAMLGQSQFWPMKKQLPRQGLQNTRQNTVDRAQARIHLPSFESRYEIADWVAQWDFEYNQWFFYNRVSDESTSEQPRALEQFKFRPPGGPHSSISSNVYNHLGGVQTQPVIRQVQPPGGGTPGAACGPFDTSLDCFPC